MDKKLPQTFKLDDKGMKSLKSAVAELQAEALAKGIPYPFTEGDKLYERRPDGTRHEITTPVTVDYGYDGLAALPLKKQKS